MTAGRSQLLGVVNIHPVPSARFTKLGVFATIVVVLAGSAAQLINYEFFGLSVRALDPGSDGGLFGVIHGIALAAAAVSAWVLAARVRSARTAAAVLAALLTFLTADDVARLHDNIPDWPAFYLPVLAASFICLVAVSRGPSGRRAERGAGRAVDRLIGAGLLLLTLSFLLHVLGPRLLVDLGMGDYTGFAYQAKATVKHATEIAGWFLVALGLESCGSDLQCAHCTRCCVVPVSPSNASADVSTPARINAN
ncbi:MAG: hypothetical protein JWO75_5432 [Actinomycetia bacterium]|nr:hypothetical protein [Actinomycetes bacterium]